ncbi:MAG: SH3 domain-containing protein [Bdellovibrionia bacterium]
MFDQKNKDCIPLRSLLPSKVRHTGALPMMLKKNHLWILICLELLVFHSQSSAEVAPLWAIVTSDRVLVRAQPSISGGKQLGLIYKNSLVSVSEKSDNLTKDAGTLYPWYQIDSENLHGWILGKYLTFLIPHPLPSTYDASSDMDWFYTQYGLSTQFSASELNVNSFQLEEYRKLMKAAEGGNDSAYAALKHSILKHLKANPKDPKTAYLRRKLHSKGFLLRLPIQGDASFFSLLPDQVFQDPMSPDELQKTLVETSKKQEGQPAQAPAPSDAPLDSASDPNFLAELVLHYFQTPETVTSTELARRIQTSLPGPWNDPAFVLQLAEKFQSQKRCPFWKAVSPKLLSRPEFLQELKTRNPACSNPVG